MVSHQLRGRGRIPIQVCVSDLQLGFLVIPYLSDSSPQYLLDGSTTETMIKTRLNFTE